MSMDDFIQYLNYLGIKGETVIITAALGYKFGYDYGFKCGIEERNHIKNGPSIESILKGKTLSEGE